MKMLDRRQFMGGVGLGLSAAALLRNASAASTSGSKIEILLNEPVGTISPDLYGYLLENLGTVIYDGVWVGEDSKIPNIGGIRKELIERLRDIKASVIRWPGGNFADYYDWKDGVGPKATRPRRTNMWSNFMAAEVPNGSQRYDPNEFGTCEFMQLCRLSGGRPFLNVNTRSLTAEDFTRWVEYCNSPAGSTTLADLRKANGSVEPYGVRYWGIGNEVWAAGGDMTVEDYAGLYKRFTSNVPTYGLDLAFIACGGPPPTADNEWVRQFLRICKKALIPVPISAMSIHYYATNLLEGMQPGQTVEQFMPDEVDWEKLTPDAVAFNTVDWYDVLGKSARMDEVIERCWEAMAEFDPAHKIKISADEWGAFEKGAALSPLNLTGRPVTLRDALAVALTLDIFQKHADKLLLALFTGLINQEGGIFRAEGDKFVSTPIYYVFQLYAAHQGGRALRTVFDAPVIQEQKGAAASLRVLSGSASIRSHDLTLSVVNSHVSEPAEAEIVIRGGAVVSGRVTTLTHHDIHAQNTFDVPNRVYPVTSQMSASGSRFRHLFPPASVSRLTLNLRDA